MLCQLLFLAACGNGSKNSESKDDKGTKTYTTDDGSKVKIPKNPKRVLVLTANYGNFKKLGVKPVAITNVFPDSKYLDMSKVKKIDPENVEAAAKLKPDLIITYKENKNNKKLAKIALTVPIKVQDMDYKDTHIEIGKLVNKEAKAKKQADKLSEKLAKDGKEIKKAIGKDNTFSIMDIQAKDIARKLTAQKQKDAEAVKSIIQAVYDFWFGQGFAKNLSMQACEEILCLYQAQIANQKAV